MFSIIQEDEKFKSISMHPFLDYYTIISSNDPLVLQQKGYFTEYDATQIRFNKDDDQTKKNCLVNAWLQDIENGETNTIGPQFSMTISRYLNTRFICDSENELFMEAAIRDEIIVSMFRSTYEEYDFIIDVATAFPRSRNFTRLKERIENNLWLRENVFKF